MLPIDNVGRPVYPSPEVQTINDGYLVVAGWVLQCQLPADACKERMIGADTRINLAAKLNV